MDPATRDYALVNGRPYTLEPLDARLDPRALPGDARTSCLAAAQHEPRRERAAAAIEHDCADRMAALAGPGGCATSRSRGRQRPAGRSRLRALRRRSAPSGCSRSSSLRRGAAAGARRRSGPSGRSQVSAGPRTTRHAGRLEARVRQHVLPGLVDVLRLLVIRGEQNRRRPSGPERRRRSRDREDGEPGDRVVGGRAHERLPVRDHERDRIDACAGVGHPRGDQRPPGGDPRREQPNRGGRTSFCQARSRSCRRTTGRCTRRSRSRAPRSSGRDAETAVRPRRRPRGSRT